ncbi:MAG: hypothetical protein ACTSQO_07695 [Candidatus Helarchaeota archaeon]
MLYKRQILGTKISTNQNFIKTISVSPDGRYIISGHWDNIIKIFDIQTCRCTKILENHSDSIYSIAFSPDNKYFASSSFDKTIKIWELETGKCIKNFKGHNDCVNSVIFSQNGKYLISGSRDKTIKIWNIQTENCIKTLKGHVGSVEIIIMTHDGSKIISGSTDGSIRLWNFKNGKLIGTIHDFGVIIYSLKISSNGKFLISNSLDNIKIWDLEELELIFTLELHKGQINSFTVTSDGKYLICGTENGHIAVWDFNNKNIINELEVSNSIEVIESIDNKTYNIILDQCFAHLDENGNIVQWIKFKNDIIQNFPIFHKLDYDEFNSFLSNLTHSKMSINKLADEIKLERADIINFISFLEDHELISGQIDKDNNFLSYLYIQESIKEILNLSGKIEIEKITQVIGIPQDILLRIMKNMIKENVLNGFFNDQESIFTTNEEFMSNIVLELKKNKILNLTKLSDEFGINKDYILKIIEDLKQRGDIPQVKISADVVQVLEEEVLPPIIELKPEEIVEIPEIKEITEPIHEKTQSKKELKITAKESKKKTKVDIYIEEINEIFLKLIKIFEILEIPAFYEETEKFFNEIFNFNKSTLEKFTNEKFISVITNFQQIINEITSKQDKIESIQCHNLEFKFISIIKDFLNYSNKQLKEIINNLKEPSFYKVINDAFNEFDYHFIKQNNLYIENILDSIILIDKNNTILFDYRFRPTYDQNLTEKILDLIKNKEKNLIHEEFEIFELKSDTIFCYLKKINDIQLLLITTGQFIPNYLSYINDLASDIKAEFRDLSNSGKQKIKSIIKSKFFFNL